MIFNIKIKQELQNKLKIFIEELKSIGVTIEDKYITMSCDDITSLNGDKKLIVNTSLKFILHIPDSLVEINKE
jgi:hypothetical protein